MIVWKLASYTNKVKECPKNKILNQENVFIELEKRYKFEQIDNKLTPI